MDKNNLVEKLKLVCDENAICRIERDNINQFKKSGKPIAFSDKFVIICYEYDFQFDGFEIIRLEDITNIYYDDIDKFINYIFTKENIQPSNEDTFNFSIHSYKDIMQFFLNENENIIIECEKCGEFYIGKIIEVFEEYVCFLGFDAEGNWDEEPSNILYNDITSISFRNRYLIYMSKYVHTIQNNN